MFNSSNYALLVNANGHHSPTENTIVCVDWGVVQMNNEIKFCKLEREYEENYFVDIGQRVDFPQVYCKPRCLQMFLKGNVFSSRPLILCSYPGKVRRRFYDLIPSAWNDRKSMKWCYDERYFDRKVEMFKVTRGYKELVERLDIERVDNIEYLPCEVIGAANDDRVDDIDYLPCDESGIAAGNNNDEIIIDLIVTNHTKGCLLYTSRCV